MRKFRMEEITSSRIFRFISSGSSFGARPSIRNISALANGSQLPTSRIFSAALQVHCLTAKMRKAFPSLTVLKLSDWTPFLSEPT